MVMPISGGVAIATRRDGAPGGVSQAQDYFAGVISDSAQQAWTQYRPDLQNFLHDQLGRGDLIRPGVTLYDITLNLPEHVAPSVERDDEGDLLVHVVTDGCYLEATSTTPTDLGKWADPRLSVAFSLDLTYRIDLPPTNSPLQSTGFEHIHVLNPVLDSHNFVADVAFMINDIIGFFSGADYVKLIEAYIAKTDFAPYVDRALAPVNAKLAALAEQGFWFLEAFVDRLDGGSGALHGLSVPGAPADRLDLLLTAVGFDLSGAIEGEISWSRFLGRPLTHGQARVVDAVATPFSPQLAAVAAAGQVERTKTWTIVGHVGAIGAAPAAAAAVVAGQGAADAGPGPAAQDASTAIASGLAALGEADRASAAAELRAGVADRFIGLVGGPARFAALQREFVTGRSDFQVPITVAVGGQGLFADQRPVGTLSSLWADDDESTFRRRFLVVGLPIDQQLQVTCRLAEDYEWSGEAAQVDCRPSGWDGSVTIHKAPVAVSLAKALADQVEVRLPDKRRMFQRSADLAERGIIFVGGHGRGDDVALNPQPLPPKALGAVQDRVAEVALNPQPLPPDPAGDLAAGRLLGGAQAGAAAVGKFQVQGHLSRRWGSPVAGVGQQAAAVIAALTRHSPSGFGTVRGIDFTVEKYVPPRCPLIGVTRGRLTRLAWSSIDWFPWRWSNNSCPRVNKRVLQRLLELKPRGCTVDHFLRARDGPASWPGTPGRMQI